MCQFLGVWAEQDCSESAHPKFAQSKVLQERLGKDRDALAGTPYPQWMHVSNRVQFTHLSGCTSEGNGGGGVSCKQVRPCSAGNSTHTDSVPGQAILSSCPSKVVMQTSDTSYCFHSRDCGT